MADSNSGQAVVVSDSTVATGNDSASPENQEQQAQPQRIGGWQFLRTIAFQLVIFYFITSFFRRGNDTPPPTGPDGSPLESAVNLFGLGQSMELYIYLTDVEGEELALDSAQLIWHVPLEFGNWEDGPLRDGGRNEDVTISVPQSIQENGTWYLHVLLLKSGGTLDFDDPQFSSNDIVHEIKLFNRFRKQRLHNTANLITGKSDIAPGAIKASEQTDGEQAKIISYWHPNITVNVVYDNTRFMKGQIPAPLDKYIQFNESETGYFPILYINDYWNLAAEYMPMNNTVKDVTLHLSFTPLSFFRFQLYASITRDNPWAQWIGQPDQSDEDQDTVKETLLETNPYLLGLTIIVSIVHSVFEFLAFKNDVQFWRSRKSLEGLSVRSVFFNVFQSLVVVLYILDNETNFVVIVSVFIGLLIDLWKITKVVEVKLDYQNLIAGVVPRLTFVDRPSYVESSTKEYDKLAFKYLGWILFPLFLSYGVYSLVYQEHKGWYSFVLSMLYGFLLTFGFITMTPQLFINYKLKSVAHLPWRMLTYKALNTFIDDMFAFVIKMPTMYRIGCFRDDIVFFIYLYQRWIYRVDYKRVNEFGTSGDDETGRGQNTANELVENTPDKSFTEKKDD